MGKYSLSSSRRNLLFPAFLATTLLLLIYAQSLYSDALRPVLVLEEDEVNTLKEVVSKLNIQQPLLRLINVFLCSDQSTIGGLIRCNCPVELTEFKCINLRSYPYPYPPEIRRWCKNITNCCRNYTTCHIRSIFLIGQRLDGEITSSIEHLPCLEDLDLSRNLLKGPIPKKLSSLKMLKKLILSKNYLNGSIPKELGTMPSLVNLDVGVNRLSGNIPKELGNIITLRSLTLTSNQLEGEIPTQLGKLGNLTTLDLADNAFNGTLPNEFEHFPNMQHFDVMGNNFSGPLPNYIGKWDKLEFFNLLGNKFEGPLDAISSSTNLVSLMISDLVDTHGKGFAFPDISKLKSLKTLILRSCSIAGEIDKHIGTLSSLKNIDLSFNNLTGALPKNINRLQLDSIYLTGNNISGPIPNWDKYWEKMNADFSHNNFSKVKFTYFKNMSSHVNLYACCNPATQNLGNEWERSTFTCPANTTNSKNTRLFINCGGNETEVNGNNYEANLFKRGGSTIYVSKKDTWAYSSTGQFLGSGGGPMDYVQETSCLDIDDAPLYTTARLSPMSLKYYGLCLKNDNYTVKLYFNEIVFTNKYDYGDNAKRVFDVFIQGNLVLKNFDIKKEANGTRKGLVKTFYTLVENNGLEIRFYWAGIGSIYTPPGLYGPLVSAISVTPVPRPPKKLLNAGQIIGIAGSTFFVMVLILTFLQKMGWLGDILMSNSGSLVGPYNFQQLKEATQNFSPDNKIGEGEFGRVYKGDCNGEVIAVKQLLSNSKEQKEKFSNEVNIFAGLEHENLVKLLGCCWDHQNNQFLIVYQFMENSLSSALFAAGNGNLKSRLNWQTRLEICLGIAKGLAFLHEEVKIIHSDIKPTNILLDKHLKAKISDFGLAKHHEEEHAHVTKVGGTSFYVAPEYAARGVLTQKADVHSFGVVMLEILSGKASTDDRLKDATVYLLDKAYFLSVRGRNLLELMDSDLKSQLNDDDVKKANKLLNLAMKCSHLDPAVRPKMSEVVDVLEGKTDLPKSFPVAAPYSDDDFRKASASAELSRSTHFGSTSRDGISDSFLSYSTSKEGNFDTPLPTPLQSIPDENANTAKNKVE